VKLQAIDGGELIELLAEVIEKYMEDHPETKPDEVAATVSYVHGCIFRLASETPPSKLH
jgi:predicted transcriptional regulator